MALLGDREFLAGFRMRALKTALTSLEHWSVISSPPLVESRYASIT
jgi:hypothetical protein